MDGENGLTSASLFKKNMNVRNFGGGERAVVTVKVLSLRASDYATRWYQTGYLLPKIRESKWCMDHSEMWRNFSNVKLGMCFCYLNSFQTLT